MTLPILVRDAAPGDIDSWLEVARDVEPLFGPMPDFRQHAERATARRTALVAVTDGVVHGAALLSRGQDQPHTIRWLAVRAESRRRRVASMLMTAILERWPEGEITATTFGADVDGGLPARRFYERHGFTCRGATHAGTDGRSRELFVRRDPGSLRR